MNAVCLCGCVTASRSRVDRDQSLVSRRDLYESCLTGRTSCHLSSIVYARMSDYYLLYVIVGHSRIPCPAILQHWFHQILAKSEMFMDRELWPCLLTIIVKVI